MRCPKCEHENPAGSAFCVECGAKLEAVCGSCGADNPPGAKFCRRCGRKVAPAHRSPSEYTPTHLAEKILSSKKDVVGERKQVTVLFADVKGSMDLQEQCDAETWSRIMDGFFSLLCEGVSRYEGTVNRFTGDGIMALFGAPIAHEDHARRACYAALHISSELGRYAQELRREKGLNFSARMGINSGEVVFGAIGDDLRMDLTALGHTVGLAARMEGIAEPGKAYLTQSTAGLVEGFFDLADLGPFSIKGAREPVRVFELRDVGAMRTRLEVARARGFSRFVGRREEQAVIEAAFERAKEGSGQIVGVVGAPGLGKSRLCFEFAERCRANGVNVREAHGVAHGRSIPYLPVLEMLRDYFGITDHDTAQQAREKVAGRLVLLDRTFEEGLPLLFDFLGIPDPERPAPRMSPEARQRELFGSIRGIVRARSRRDPVVLLLEDLHWIDAGSQAFLDAIVDSLPGTRSLVLTTFRPEYHATWMQKSYYRSVPLEPLGAAAIREMLDDRLGDDPSLGDLADRIGDRAQGNPFFMEEVVQGLVESGALEGSRGRYRLARRVDQIAIPASVEAVLAARIDRLDEHEKALLQTASVIGKEFTEPVLARVTGPQERGLAPALQALIGGEFLYEAALYPEIEYAFKHPLTQEVAYRSQLAERRARVHGEVARALIELYPDKLEERAALLAHHFQAAGEPVEAARWHATASVWVGRSDHLQALQHLRTARSLLEVLPESPETLGMLLLVCIQILTHAWRIGIEEAEGNEVYERARSLAERLDDRMSLLVAIGLHAAVKGLRGEVAEALEFSREAASLLTDRPEDEALRLTTCVNLSFFTWVAGDYRASLAVTEEGIAEGPADPMLGADLIGFSPSIWLVGFRGNILAWMGRVQEGAPEIDRALELTRTYGDVECEGWMHGLYSSLAVARGDPSVLGNHPVRAVEIAERLGSAFSKVIAHFNLGEALRLEGRFAESAEALLRGLGIAEERRVGLEQTPFMRGSLAEAYLQLGDARARATAEEAVAGARRLGTKAFEALTLYRLARVLVKTEGAAAAEEVRAVCARSRAMAEECGMVTVIPMLVETLADLARAEGDHEAYRRLLGEAHRLFVEAGATGHAETLLALIS